MGTLAGTSLSGDVEVVARTVEHVESFHRAFDAVARERRYLTFLEAPPLPETRTFARAMIAAGDPQFVAVAAGDVVGWCDIQRRDFPAHAHRGTLGMGVVAGYRGQGLGRRLIDATLGAAFAGGLTRVELDVHADNAPAIALYESVGFVREGVVRDAFLADGVYRDAIAMAIVRR